MIEFLGINLALAAGRLVVYFLHMNVTYGYYFGAIVGATIKTVLEYRRIGKKPW